MNNLNTVLIEGTLTRDPTDERNAEFTRCRLAIANNRYFLDASGNWKPDSSYFYVYVYGPVAESCLRILKKGRGVRVVGRLKQQSWRGYDGWQERVYIIAEHIEFQPERAKDKQPEVTPEKKSFPNTKTDAATLREIEEQASAMPDQVPMPDLPQSQQENEPVAATILDDGMDEDCEKETSGPENFVEGDDPF